MSLIVEAIGGVLLRVVWWLLLFPVMWLLATPVVFVAAAFAPLPYWSAVLALYGSVTHVWGRWGLEIFSWL